MTDHSMTTAILWEHMLLADQYARAGNEPAQGLGHSVSAYRAQNGIAETRQLAVDLAPVANRLWDMFEPVHECSEPFDMDWSYAFLFRLSSLSEDLSCSSRLFQFLSAAEASGALDLESGVADLIGLHGFNAEHKMVVVEPDGSSYVEDYNEEDAEGSDGFWTVYGRNEDGLVFALADINTGDHQCAQGAAEKLATDITEWLEQAA